MNSPKSNENLTTQNQIQNSPKSAPKSAPNSNVSNPNQNQNQKPKSTLNGIRNQQHEEGVKQSKDKKRKKKKGKVSRLLGRRRRGGEDESEDESLDGSQSNSSSSDSSESDDDADGGSGESGSEEASENEGEEEEVHSEDEEGAKEEEEQDESIETKVEVNEVSDPKPLDNSTLTEPTTVSDSLNSLSISKDWAQDVQEQEQVKTSSSLANQEDASSSIATPNQISSSSTPNAPIPNSKKSKSQKRREAKARKLAAAEASNSAQPNAPSGAQQTSTSNSTTRPSNPAQSKNASRVPTFGNHDNRFSGASRGVGGGRGGAPPAPSSARGGYNGNGNGPRFSDSSFRGGRGGFNMIRGGGRGGSNSNLQQSRSKTKGKMMSWSDDEEDENGNLLVVDEDALEGKAVKTLPRELRIPTAPRALREKQQKSYLTSQRKENSGKETDSKPSTSKTETSAANGSKEGEISSPAVESSNQASPSGHPPATAAQAPSSTPNHVEFPTGKWDHGAFESLAASGNLDRRSTAGRGRGGKVNSPRGSLDSRASPLPSGNGQVPPSGPRSMSKARSPLNPDSLVQTSQAGNDDPREQAQQLVSSQESGALKVKVPSSTPRSDQKQEGENNGAQTDAQAQDQPKLPSFPPSVSSSSQRAQSQHPPASQSLASLPPGYAMDATGVVFDLRSGVPVAVGFMNNEPQSHDAQQPGRQQHPLQQLQPQSQPQPRQQQQPENKHLLISRQGHARSPSSIPSSAIKAAAFYPGSNAGSSNAGSDGRKTPAQREPKSSNDEPNQQTQLHNSTSPDDPGQPPFNQSDSLAHSESPQHQPPMMNPYSSHPLLSSHSPYYDYSSLPPQSPYDPQSIYHQQLQAQFAYSAATGTPPPGTPILYGTPPPTAFNPYAHHPQDPYFASHQNFDYGGGYYHPQY